ncbi:hypothetical protein [Rhizobium azibense]|uniref:Uncharacterized protein n=1 Tax=Rhizobium azibense TaxID=1136135 RepID=A0A4R3RGA2_9HYPH|nr:hypothetical protein [Rhizobium azibense]TCU34031.1 hypothetical protein EV129_11314 [Rhizobium azibense]
MSDKHEKALQAAADANGGYINGKTKQIVIAALNASTAPEARRHAVALRQCSLFATDVGENIVKAMMDAADFLEQSSGLVLAGEAVKVRELEWNGTSAECVFGLYHISRVGNNWTVEFGRTQYDNYNARVTGVSTDFDAALIDGRAVAQADYEQRILSALAAPHPVEQQTQQTVGRQEVIDFLYKHGDLTYSAAARAVQLLAGNGYGFTSSSQERIDDLRRENVKVCKALGKIADMLDAEDADLDDAITIAIAALATASEVEG